MRYRFGDFTLDLDLYELRRSGEPVEIQPKAFDLLRHLVENGERTVPKEELLDSVWPGVVVGEAALTQAVRQVRRALDDGDGEDSIIRTVRRRGYRLGVSVAAADAGIRAEPETPATPVDPTPGPAIERRLAALLSVDVVAYSRHIGRDDVRTVQTLTGHREEIARLVTDHGGRVVDSPGDNVLAEFPSAREATRCGLEIQGVVGARNEALPTEERMDLRIGVHLGDVLVEGGRLYGDGVNVAARLESLAEAGGLCISSNVHEQLGALGASFEDLGEQQLKNIGHPVRVLRYAPDAGGEPETAGTRPRTASETLQRQRRWVVVAGALVLLLLLGWLARPVDIFAPASVAASAAPSPNRSAIAVLPFADLSAEGDQRHLADGLAEEILLALSRDPGLRVAARTSSFGFRDNDADVRAIAEQLGVGTVLEGSVRREQGRLRITVQLIDAIDGFHLWSESYDRPASDVFGVQQEIADAIASRLSPGRGDGPPSSPYVPAPEAYDAYLLGRAEANLRTRESLERSVEHLEDAIEIDPGYAAAHAELALTQVIRRDFEGHFALEAAEAAATRALELDPNVPGAHMALAQVRRQNGDMAAAEELSRRALELSPGDASSWEHFGSFLAYHGRAQEAVAAMQRGLDLDPLSPLLQRQTGRMLLYAGETDRAIAHLLRTLELHPGDMYAPSLLWVAFEQKGMPSEAREALMRLAPGWLRPAIRATGRLFGTPLPMRIALGPAAWLSPPCTVRPDSGVLLYAYVGDADGMFACMNYLVEEERDLGYVKLHPFYDRYRADPRFVQVLRRAGLE
jgi:TolB-like protein/class 3 adenylate cyclase/Tfp pilus assembly protein PilF